MSKPEISSSSDDRSPTSLGQGGEAGVHAPRTSLEPTRYVPPQRLLSGTRRQAIPRPSPPKVPKAEPALGGGATLLPPAVPPPAPGGTITRPLSIASADALEAERELTRALHATPRQRGVSLMPELGVQPDVVIEPAEAWQTKATVRPVSRARAPEVVINDVSSMPPVEKAPSAEAGELGPFSLRRAFAIVIGTQVVLSFGIVGAMALLRPASTSPRATEAPSIGASELEQTSRDDRKDESGARPPAQGCVLSSEAATLAARAQLGAGLDVAALDSGFGVAFASSATEAIALRVEGSRSRVAELVRAKSSAIVGRALVDTADENRDAVGVRVDSSESRSVLGRQGMPSFRVSARAGAVLAVVDEPAVVRDRRLWPVPAGGTVFDRYAFANARAAGRGDGTAAVLVQRGTSLWVGHVDASLAPTGPLAVVPRGGAIVGAPALGAWGSGEAIAWAELRHGERRANIVVTGGASDAQGAPVVGAARVIAAGIAPTVAELPDGDLLLAYADGPDGARRIVARRLAPDLSTRGEPFVVSPPAVDAAQPALAVRSDGAALVAFFAGARGHEGVVMAGRVSCDPGLSP
jgi:hypothetical protein